MKLFKIFLGSSIVMLSGCQIKNALTVYSDIKPSAIEKVSLDSYADVQDRDGQDPNLSLGIAISGGGSRAQYYSLGILMALEELYPCQSAPCDSTRNFLRDIDYYSTVSGGGFAAGYYLGARKNGLMKERETLHDFWKSTTRLNSYGEEINYNATLTNLIFSNFNRYEKGRKRPTSFPNLVNRQLLQAGKPGPTAGITIPSLTLADFFAETGKPALPMLIANGTIYNNAERLPFMPHILKSLKINGSEMSHEPLCESCTTGGYKKGQYNNGFSMPLKYAIAASSAFPGLIPQVKFRVEDNKFLRVVDGGAVDNLGYTTLIEVLAAEKSTRIGNRKRALVIDCSGAGIQEIYGDSAIRKFDLLAQSLFFTISTKYVNFNNDIQALMVDKGLPNRRGRDYLKIGITDLRDTAHQIILKKLIHVDQEVISHANEYNTITAQTNISAKEKAKSDQIRSELDEIFQRVDSTEFWASVIVDSLNRDNGRRMTSTERAAWWNKYFSLFEKLLDKRLMTYGIALPKPAEGLHKMDYLERKDFQKFTGKDKALLILLYELAAQVETNVKIPSTKEKSILILAGRFTVYLKRDKLAKLYLNLGNDVVIK
jgi:hypothetical protein